MRIGLDIPHELDYELERPRPREEEQSEVSLQPERNPVQEHLPALRERAAEHRLNHEPPRGPRSLQQKHDIDAPSRQRNKDPREQTDERRTRRDHLPRRAIGLPLRSEERKVMLELGRFRVAQVPHLAEAIYDGRQRRLNDDLNYLRSKGLVETRNINMRRGGVRREVERVEVASLTREGRAWLTHSGDVPQDQKVYYGFVKPREIEHDSLIYRACRDASQRIEQDGGTNLRVKLDFELKAEVQRDIYRARKEDPKRDMADIKKEVAEEHELPFINGGIQIPDARIEFDRDDDRKRIEDRDQGSRSGGHEDIEVLTAAYGRSHLRAKAQSGFHNYATSADCASITARIEDDRGLMENILDL